MCYVIQCDLKTLARIILFDLCLMCDQLSIIYESFTFAYTLYLSIQ